MHYNGPMREIFVKTCQDASTKARNGYIDLPHGRVITPAFMPVGTNGTVKGIYHDKVEAIGYRLILGNTYHLYLRPGTDVIGQFGGLHEFSNWNHNILTDSGGFQIFSLPGLRKVKKEGVSFQSHIDGSRHFFSPEKVVDIQHILGSDIAMTLDYCTPPDITYKKAIEALKITEEWGQRSVDHVKSISDFRGNLFAIVQGNFFRDLRKESAEFVSSLDTPGIAIGGLSVGEKPEVFKDFLAYTMDMLPENKPRYVMGIGSPDYLLEAVQDGVDIFDCVMATRMARHGTVFTDDGPISLSKAQWAFDKGPIESGCTCDACTRYSRAYLRHMFKAEEMFGGMLATEHNLTYLYHLMERTREAIQKGCFADFKKDYLERYYFTKQD